MLLQHSCLCWEMRGFLTRAWMVGRFRGKLHMTKSNVVSNDVSATRDATNKGKHQMGWS